MLNIRSYYRDTLQKYKEDILPALVACIVSILIFSVFKKYANSLIWIFVVSYLFAANLIVALILGQIMRRPTAVFLSHLITTVLLLAIYTWPTDSISADVISRSVAVSNHTGGDIDTVIVNGTWAANISAYGEGGAGICCVNLPRKWTPDLQVPIKWRNVEATQPLGGSINEGWLWGEDIWHTAQAKVLPYTDEPHEIRAHFMPNGEWIVEVQGDSTNLPMEKPPKGWKKPSHVEHYCENVNLTTMTVDECKKRLTLTFQYDDGDMFDAFLKERHLPLRVNDIPISTIDFFSNFPVQNWQCDYEKSICTQINRKKTK
jgi:hypothetical protein